MPLTFGTPTTTYLREPIQAMTKVFPHTLSTVCWMMLVAVSAASAADSTEPSPEQLRFFEQDVRPLLVEHCSKCHGEEKQSGGLRLDSIGALLGGGDSGPAIVAGKPAESLLVEAINWESYEMPPSGKLDDEAIDVLTRWVEMGAPWPGGDREAMVRPTVTKITEEDRAFWSFRPLSVPEAPAAAASWGQNDIDAFILRKLQEQNLSPAPRADRTTLVRRLYQAVTGLPPTPEQVDAFVHNESPDAYEKLVDELLVSERYGEHLARFWLDLVRYAESDGWRQDAYRPHAWRYRDYVIRSFNADKPYDRFVQEQLAGDEIAPGDPEALAATGYYRHGIYEYNQRDAVTQWSDMLNDITDTTGDVFLGLGMGCARCHDHKFDPILQKDYFRLQAFFANIWMRDDIPIATSEEIAAFQQQMAVWEEQTVEIRAKLDELEGPKRDALAKTAIGRFTEDIQAIMAKPADERTAYETQIADLVDRQVLAEYGRLSSKFKGEEKERWEALKKELAAFDAIKPAPLPEGRTATDVGVSAPTVYIPGKERLGEVAPGFLSVFEEDPAEILPPGEMASTGRRTTLARWLTRPDHPLTTRVITNRIWQQLFGTGLVATPSDFGHLGEPPSHPELLDWLARRFVEEGWSLKWLHREILLSETFRQSAHPAEVDVAMKTDPGNRLLWRFPIRRLTAEQIRDAMLAVSGELKESVGGPSVDASAPRRSIYMKVRRNSPDPLLKAFDFPDRVASIGERNVTTTPSQSLLMINGGWPLERSQKFASRLTREVPRGDESRVRRAYQLAIAREPSETELSRAVGYLEAQRERDEERRRELLPETESMPSTESAAVVVSDGKDHRPLQSRPNATLPEGDFTVEAVVMLRSLYPDATVRTIVSQWDSSTGHPGWSLGVTSTKSGYKPRNLILQLVGKDSAGKLKYEVVASNLRPELNRPYYVAVSVDLDETGEAGVTFCMKDLSHDDAIPQWASASHHVVSGYTNSEPLLIGGRSTSKAHRWDGLIDEVRLTDAALPKESLGSIDRPLEEATVGKWTFEADGLLADRSSRGHDLTIGNASAFAADPALVDLCQILMNSNEFLYVD
ncbi:DUF1553 domain-containing protein [Maioricimonas rarisocia]|uniref:DUF1553 domain-containing protein n=1 Tax=Maioricimonas rarisocia TaxID=2528026 RepID=UPI0018D2248E|nr:DUF1553 domain-containing protein [Maioricimonas rarisocia]